MLVSQSLVVIFSKAESASKVASLRPLLQKYFGYDTFRPFQMEIMSRILEGENVLAIMPTGGGKSLCYQLPALAAPGLAIVVSPLIALMEDQVSSLRQNGVKAEFLNSSLSGEMQREILSDLRSLASVHKKRDSGTKIEDNFDAKNQDLDDDLDFSIYSNNSSEVHPHDSDEQIKLLYISPERLFNPEFWELLQTLPISFFAIDEAHCLSTWGHDFRPEYTQLRRLKHAFPKIPILALTATADELTRSDLLNTLGLVVANTTTQNGIVSSKTYTNSQNLEQNQPCQVFIASFDRPNIHYKIEVKQDSFKKLQNFLGDHVSESGIVYCLSRKSTEEVAKKLNEVGFKAAAYHAGLDNSIRSKVLQKFMQEDIDIVVATVAFGMGIDKSNVRFVVHWDLPKNIENYYQETGRAGRDGLLSQTMLLFSLGDIVQLKGFIAQSSNPKLSQDANNKYREVQEAKLERLLEFCQTNYCRRRVLLNYFGEAVEADCGLCDVCDNPRAKFDGTEITQKALSAIVRTKQGFGMNYIVDILVGSNNQRVILNGHENLPTFGVGSDLSREKWFIYLKDMVNIGLIDIAYDDYRKLRVTPKALKVLKNEEKVELFTSQEAPVKSTKTEKGKLTKAGKKALLSDLDESGQQLFEKLRVYRKELATQNSVPPFVVFSDATLIAIVESKPIDKQQFSQLSGVGAHKLELYWEGFTGVVKDFKV